MPNRLQNEKSEYLLQHKDNPVDWFPWGKEDIVVCSHVSSVFCGVLQKSVCDVRELSVSYWKNADLV